MVDFGAEFVEVLLAGRGYCPSILMEEDFAILEAAVLSPGFRGLDSVWL